LILVSPLPRLSFFFSNPEETFLPGLNDSWDLFLAVDALVGIVFMTETQPHSTFASHRVRTKNVSFLHRPLYFDHTSGSGNRMFSIGGMFAILFLDFFFFWRVSFLFDLSYFSTFFSSFPDRLPSSGWSFLSFLPRSQFFLFPSLYCALLGFRRNRCFAPPRAFRLDLSFRVSIRSWSLRPRKPSPPRVPTALFLMAIWT